MTFTRDGIEPLPYEPDAPRAPSQARRVIPRFMYHTERGDDGQPRIIEHVKFLIPGDSKAAPVRLVTDEIRQQYAPEYNAWKREEDAPPNGTAIRDWASASERQRALLAAYAIVTVEQLADLNDGLVQNLGMDGTLLRGKARAWLLVQQDSAKLDAIVSDSANKDLKIKELQDTIADLKAQLAASRGEDAGPRAARR